METVLPGIKTLPSLPPRTETERSVENSSDDGFNSESYLEHTVLHTTLLVSLWRRKCNDISLKLT